MFVCLDCVCCYDSLPQYRLGFLYYYRCRLRILDSFGTDPEFNYAEFRDANKYKTSWGKADVHVRQMMTMFRKYDMFRLSLLTGKYISLTCNHSGHVSGS